MADITAINQPSMDFSFGDFVEKLYQMPAQPAFAFHIEFLDTINSEELRKLLAHFVITGAKRKYNKELTDLLPNEIEHLQEYLASIGFKIEFKVESMMQKLDLKKKSDKETHVNYFLIDFIPLNPSTNMNNMARHLE